MAIIKNEAGNGDFVAPDGGWGWVVVISSLLIHLVMDGITYSLGTYLSVFVNQFGVSHGEASIVHSLLPAVTLMAGKKSSSKIQSRIYSSLFSKPNFHKFKGPIASLFTNKYGCRWTTIIGTLIATFGFILCFFVERFFFFYITIGVIVGKIIKFFANFVIPSLVFLEYTVLTKSKILRHVYVKFQV
jgi:hypothetical protein